MSVTLKSVYFTDDGKWFENRTEAEEHELKEELLEFIKDCQSLEEAVVRLVTRYSISEHYNYAQRLLNVTDTIPEEEV